MQDRRGFLKLLGVSGLAAMAPSGFWLLKEPVIECVAPVVASEALSLAWMTQRMAEAVSSQVARMEHVPGRVQLGEAGLTAQYGVDMLDPIQRSRGRRMTPAELDAEYVAPAAANLARRISAHRYTRTGSLPLYSDLLYEGVVAQSPGGIILRGMRSWDTFTHMSVTRFDCLVG